MLILIQLINTAATFYMYALIIYIFMSWLPNVRESSFGQALGKICEPYLDIFRRFIPPIGMIDISPIVAIFALQLALKGVISVLFYLM